jgi:hypothetical protein
MPQRSVFCYATQLVVAVSSISCLVMSPGCSKYEMSPSLQAEFKAQRERWAQQYPAHNRAPSKKPDLPLTEEQKRKSEEYFARQAERAEWIKHPHEATATAAPYLEGALVCRDAQAVRLAYHLEIDHAQDLVRDKAANGQLRLLRPLAPKPHVEYLGCTLKPVGTKMFVSIMGGIPVVTADLDGKEFEGVTSMIMFQFKDPIPQLPW